MSKTSSNSEKVAFKEVSEELEMIKFETNKSGAKSDNGGFKLLGDLLGYLRSARAMSALMVCRQIKNIEIENDMALLSGDDSILELETNEKLKSDVSPFFEKLGLGFKIKEKVILVNEEDKLKELLGNKLIIKN